MIQENFNKIIDALSDVRHYCDNQRCNESCVFCTTRGCMFFNQPYSWEIGGTIEKYEEQKKDK